MINYCRPILKQRLSRNKLILPIDPINPKCIYTLKQLTMMGLKNIHLFNFCLEAQVTLITQFVSNPKDDELTPRI